MGGRGLYSKKVSEGDGFFVFKRKERLFDTKMTFGWLSDGGRGYFSQIEEETQKAHYTCPTPIYGKIVNSALCSVHT
jgi:hypothetical protein